MSKSSDTLRTDMLMRLDSRIEELDKRIYWLQWKVALLIGIVESFKGIFGPTLARAFN